MKKWILIGTGIIITIIISTVLAYCFIGFYKNWIAENENNNIEVIK